MIRSLLGAAIAAWAANAWAAPPPPPSARLLALRDLAGAGEHDRVAAGLRNVLIEPGIAAREPVDYVAALDGVVFLRDPRFVELLVRLIASGDRRAEAPAAIALDRLAHRNPLGVARALDANPAFLADRPRYRADLYAKLDPRDDAQRLVLERYLGDSNRPLDERSKCLASLLEQGIMAGGGVFTAGEPLPRPSPARRRAVMAALASWRANPRFTVLRGTIDRLLDAERNGGG